MTKYVILSLFIITLTSKALCKDLSLANTFSDGIVLQREKPINVWGYASPEQPVTLKFGEEKKTTKANSKGQWSIKIGPLMASSEPRTMTIESGKSELRIADILVGEVWVCGGQSNMAWIMRGSTNADIEISAANFPEIRFLKLPNVASPRELDDFPLGKPTDWVGKWQRAVAPEVQNCSAAAYYFARRLHRQLKVPVGIIENSWGGTMAQHWCNKNTLKQIPEMAEDIKKFDDTYQAWIDGGKEAGAQKRFAQDIAEWEKNRAEAKAKGEKEPRKPNANQYKNPGDGRQPAGMFNGSLLPIANATIRGILFYQGENNSFGTSWKPFYRTFPAVISDWRKAFNDPEIPFGIVQIAGWSNRRSMEYDMNHHCNVVREIQMDTWLNTANTGLIATYDTNSNGSIHPGRKLPVGERSARWALSEVYKIKRFGSNDPLEWKGPLFKEAKFESGKAFVTFEEGTDRGLRLDQDVDVGFVLAGKDKIFHHAKARITQSKKDKRPQIEIWCDEVKEPVAVRYAFSNLPIGGLMNAREIPAYPFRSDNWPMTPHQSTGSYIRSKK
jgi:sialate O-acetylesterase